MQSITDRPTESPQPIQDPGDPRRIRSQAADFPKSPPSAAPTADLDDPQYFFNRELSLLAFQTRVLGEAKDPAIPLLERVKFLAILGSNLDEFFMVRVAALRKQQEAGVADLSLDGRSASDQLAAIRLASLDLMIEARRVLHEEIIPGLAERGVQLQDYADLGPADRAALRQVFAETMFPVLTPLAFDPGHPFPHISNLSLNLAVLVRDASDRRFFARVKIPGTLPRFVPIPPAAGFPSIGPPLRFVWLEEVIADNLEALFPGMEVLEAHPFRVTRDADLTIQELEAADLMESVAQNIRRRRFGIVVRVTVNAAMPNGVRSILMENLGLEASDLYALESPLGLSGLMGLYSVDRPDLKYPPLLPSVPEGAWETEDPSEIFAVLRRGGLLLHHPYDSFDPVVEFLRAAALDPRVLAIKQTLYRVGNDSPVVEALLEASRRGKQVAVLLELKARFDEESNIGWARALEREGVHVVYGLLGLKTHSKVALVVRREDDGLRRYVHLSTGNYNAITAQVYEDVGLLTCDEDLGADATDLFNFLTGYSAKEDYRKLLVAPVNLRARLQALIDREIRHAREGRPAHLIFKVNSLVDKALIQQLYRASQGGVSVDLLVRGTCCLRPGMAGVSDHIRVVSVVGRFLEHSRIFFFQNGDRPEVYLGSADLMPRNLDHRVEVLFPVDRPEWIAQLREVTLAAYLADNVNAYDLVEDGTYRPRRAAPGEPERSSQAMFLQLHAKARHAIVPEGEGKGVA